MTPLFYVPIWQSIKNWPEYIKKSDIISPDDVIGGDWSSGISAKATWPNEKTPFFENFVKKNSLLSLFFFMILGFSKMLYNISKIKKNPYGGTLKSHFWAFLRYKKWRHRYSNLAEISSGCLGCVTVLLGQISDFYDVPVKSRFFTRPP